MTRAAGIPVALALALAALILGLLAGLLGPNPQADPSVLLGMGLLLALFTGLAKTSTA